MPIHLLNEHVIAQIAAGEVIERPASVVKELVENALDAGATTIHIHVTAGGKSQIRVSDNGLGIIHDELELAITRHATSKLNALEDLETIRTLGFRGEALASIASVSQFTLTSRTSAEDAGAQIRVDGGRFISERHVGVPSGSVVTVENLFFNTPARLKFLKADATEKRHITSVVTNYALARPDVRFTLEQDGRELLRTHGTGALADVLLTLMGADDFKNMVEVDSPATDQGGRSAIGVYGFSSAPDFTRGDRTRITLFVNGRSIQDSKLTYAVIQAYHTFLMNGRYPIAILLIDVPPDNVDVNVHPTKAEVRFRDPNAVFSAVQRAVRRAVVQDASPIVSMRSGSYQTELPTETRVNLPLSRIQSDSAQIDMNLSIDNAGQYARQRDLYSHRGESAYFANRDDRDNDQDPTAIPVGMGAPQSPRTLPMLRVVGQIGAAYIVTEGPAGLYLIDQHAAHERILYEQYMAAYRQQGIVSQQVLTAQNIQLSPIDARLIEENMQMLNSVGFDFEPFGPNMFSVRAVPAMLADANPQAVVAAMISDLELGNIPGEGAIEEKIILRICKQIAVKAGQVLSQSEMQGLIRQLERCESPHTCPHGRPTILHLSADQLAREFGRLGSR